MLIIARTDARTTLGLDEALRRADAYANAGADVLFVESPENEDEMRRIGRMAGALGVPLLANMVDGGKTPMLSRDTLAALGYRIAIFPVTALLAAAQAMSAVYGALKSDGSSHGLAQPLLAFDEMTRLMGFPAVHAFERRWADGAADDAASRDATHRTPGETR
jgi:2-methylisocitrate lyase-like PEP mutase family enzyme